jgi:hypothetical protein
LLAQPVSAANAVSASNAAATFVARALLSLKSINVLIAN